jgi:hypothetical protein
MGRVLRALALAGAITLASIVGLIEEAQSTAGHTPTIQIGLWNSHRVNVHNLPRWSGYSPTMSRIACRHAYDMGRTVSGRLYHTDISHQVGSWRWLGQVVGYTSDPRGTQSLFKAYHNSAPHRAVWEVRRTVYVGDCAVWSTKFHRWYHVANFRDP